MVLNFIKKLGLTPSKINFSTLTASTMFRKQTFLFLSELVKTQVFSKLIRNGWLNTIAQVVGKLIMAK